MSEFDLLRVDRGSIVAPAGCGKTHLITQSLKRFTGDKPVLVLTHTNAGVAALRKRLNQMEVPRASYRLMTLDGWALRIVSCFPRRSGYGVDVVSVDNPKQFYPLVRKLAVELVRNRHIDELLRATYSRVIVDEYQDCSIQQHELVANLQRLLPTCVLGDPMQAIFDFGEDPLADWESDVLSAFPEVQTLSTPHRWNRQCQPELGKWLLSVRHNLKAGGVVHLRTAPKSVIWIPLSDENRYQTLLRAAYTKPPSPNDSILIIADSINDAQRHRIASRVGGSVVVEPVELGDFVAFADKFNLKKLTGPTAFQQLLQFATTVMTNVSLLQLPKRLNTISKGRSRKAITETEDLALRFVRQPTYGLAAKLLDSIRRQTGVRAYRPILLKAVIDALNLSEQGAYESFSEAASRVRERLRYLGRDLPRRAVGSTLLLKGLEAEVAVVLNADRLDRRNLYVAMTRGSKRLVICSSKQVLRPEK